jgi:hypothetical protein
MNALGRSDVLDLTHLPVPVFTPHSGIEQKDSHAGI